MSDYKMPYREQNSNKGTFGKVLNIAGSDNYIGAAYLSTKSILKSGAGFAALYSVPKVINIVAQNLPEAVYIDRNQKFKDYDKFSVLLIGCGLGLERKSKKVFANALKKASALNLPTVIDADGLNILSESELALPKNTIITPHPMEAARLLKTVLTEVLDNLESSAKKLSEKYNSTVILKTHRTIICSGEKLYINQHGNSSLAKAGTGDVLAGIISGLLAQKMEPFEAAKLGVYLHSRAGEIASEKLTQYSVLASDVIGFLPEAIKEIV